MKKLIIVFLFTFSPCFLTAQWVKTNGPYGGYVQCFEISGTNLFAGTPHGGVYLSTNNGSNWTVVNNGLTNLGIRSLASSGTNLYAGTDNGVYLSTNNGTSWSSIGLVNQRIASLIVSGTNLFAGALYSEYAVYLSTNNGTSWTSLGLTNQNVGSLAVLGTRIFAGTNNGVFLSTNNGFSWNPTTSAFTITSLAVLGTNVFAGTWSGGGILLSTNNGTSWTSVNNGLTYEVEINTLFRSGTKLYAGTDKGAFSSINNGSSWTSLGLTNQNVRSIAVLGTNTFAAYGEGISLSSNNGTNWTAINNGLNCQEVWSLTFSGTKIFTGTGSGGVFLSSNNGSSWTSINDGLTNQWVLALSVLGTNIFAGTGGGVFLSTNSGTSWITANNGLTDNVIRAIIVSGTNLFAGTEDGVFLSTNNGTSWTATGLWGNIINALAVSGTNLFAGATGGNIYLSTNNGTSWTTVAGMNNNILSLAVLGTNIFAGTGDYPIGSGGVYLSTNNGANWTAVNNGLTNRGVTALVNFGTNLLAGTYGGVFLSTNNGTTWINKNQGFNVAPIVGTILITINYVFAGTYGNSVWKRSLSDFIPLQVPTNLAYDTIENRLVWTLSLSSNVANYLVYKKGSDNIWRSVADSGGMLNSTANFYNIQTSGFNYYKVAAISNSGDTAKSDSIYVNRGYVLKKWNSGIIEPYKIKKHSFSFGNTTANMWPSSVYSHYNNYSQPPYPRELFMKKRGPFWVTKIHSRAFSDWELFTDIFGNENCYLHHGSIPPQTGDVFNKKAVDIWYSSLRNNRFYDGLISDFPGVCVGFSITSALSFAKNASFYNQFPVMNNVDNLYELNLSGANGNEIRKVINHLGAINYIIPMPRETQSTSPREMLSQLVDSLSKVRDINKQFKMALGLADEKSGKFVHAVFPYAIERDPLDNNNFYIYVYDSKRPGNENRRILINTNTDNCTYEDYNQNKLKLYAEIDKYLGTQKLPGIVGLEFNKNYTGNIFTPLYTSNKNSILIIDPITTDTIAGFRNSDSTLYGDLDRILIPMTDGRFNIPQSYYIPLQNTNILMKDLVNDSSGVFVSYFADTNTFIRYERYDSISPDQTDILRIFNGSLSMYNPDAFVKKINLTSIISSNSTINNQKTFEVNNFGLNYHDSVSSIIVDASKMKLKNYGLQSSYDLSLIYSDSNTSKYFNHINIIIPENSSHIVSPVWDSVYTQPVQIYVDIGNNGTIDDTLRLINIITNAEEVSVSMPDRYSLAQNYPNPFNPSTLIKYNIKSDGLVTLKVYDVLGKEVVSLVNELKQSGRYEVEFNGSNLGSGIYYYRLQAGEYSETKKMLLLK